MHSILLVILTIAAFIDLRVQKIPNYLTFPSLLGAIAWHAGISGVHGLLFSLGGMLVGVSLFIIPYALGGMGAGDAKLVGVIGAFLGPVHVVIASLIIALTGGLYALIVLVIHRRYGKALVARLWQTGKTFFLTRQFIYIPASENEKQPKLCYGLAIAIGTIIFISLESSGYRFPLL